LTRCIRFSLASLKIHLASLGADGYTHKNVTNFLSKLLAESQIKLFVDTFLLPTINAMPENDAHVMKHTFALLNCTPAKPEHADISFYRSKIMNAPTWVKESAAMLIVAFDVLGEEGFRVHPKGHGAVVTDTAGIKEGSLVTYYRGEVYPSWRWSEKQEAVEKTQERCGMQPELPEFYNMALERPKSDPRGYGLLFVDASRKASMGSNLSHSCNPACEVKVVSVDNSLALAMTTVRDIAYGEEVSERSERAF